MKLTVSTSNGYLHILPIFIHLFQKYWSPDQKVEIVGYDKPNIELPENFPFYSMGKQEGGSKSFGTDLRKYFEKQNQHVCWLMEDSFLKSNVNQYSLQAAKTIINTNPNIGRVSLTNQNLNQYTENYPTSIDGYKFVATPQLSEYRLSTMPAIWNKDFLLQYLQPEMNPWEFECQTKVEDKWINLAFEDRDAQPITHNEGVRRFDLFKYNFENIEEGVVEEMRQMGYLKDATW